MLDKIEKIEEKIIEVARTSWGKSSELIAKQIGLQGITGLYMTALFDLTLNKNVLYHDNEGLLRLKRGVRI